MALKITFLAQDQYLRFQSQKMAAGLLLSVLIIVHVQWMARCDFNTVDYFSKDLDFRVPMNATHRVSVIVSTPESDVYWKYFYFNYVKCDSITSDCEVGQDCFNCPAVYKPKKCHFTLPHNDTFPLEQVTLRSFADRPEYIIVDWASRAIVNETCDKKSSRKIQVISMANCFVHDIPIEIASADNGMRKIVLDALPLMKSFDAFYIDYRICRDSGWVRTRYSEDGKPFNKPECVFGLKKSKHKFFMDVVVGSDLSEIVLDKSKDNWTLYELKNQSNEASELYKSPNHNGDLFHIPRLCMHGDDFGSVCWLADMEPSYNLNCTIFRANPKYIRNLSLEFHYRVRDFELKMVDFKRIYVLTSSSDDTSCFYDLWIFDINGQLIDGPLRIQGPRCVFTRRLEPRPALTQLNRDKICVSFAFELAPSVARPTRDKRFTVMTECLLHSNERR